MKIFFMLDLIIAVKFCMSISITVIVTNNLDFFIFYIKHGFVDMVFCHISITIWRFLEAKTILSCKIVFLEV